jgi:hypothetical protein
MDGATTTVVILIFVFSILGAVTGKKDRVQRPTLAPPPPQAYEQPADQGTVHTQVDVLTPGENFMAGNMEGLNDRLKGFISSYGKNMDGGDSQTIADSIAKYSQQYDVNPKVVCALIARESRFNKFAISSSGAQGLGQLLPSTASGLGVTDPFDIDQNVMGTTRYIRSMIDRFSGPDRLSMAIAGYFEGPNSVKRAGGFKPKSKSYIEDIYRTYAKI